MENKITHFITIEQILISDERHVLQEKIKGFIHQTIGMIKDCKGS
jgi:hypothetical protein